MKHLENMNKVMLVTGMLVTYGYVMEHFIAWYSGNPYEFAQFFTPRQRGPMAGVYWTMIFCNVHRAAALLVQAAAAPTSR